MITFTKEQLLASAHARIEFAEMMLAGELEPLKERTWSIEMELARIALASLEAEPVAFIGQRMLEELTDGARSCGRVWSEVTDKLSDEDRIPLFAAPPATVSMKDHQIRELVNELRDIAVDYHGTQQLRERIARTIRAAMLQGDEPVTTAYKLPEGWVAVPVEPTEEMIAAAMCSNDVLFDKEDDTLFRVQHGEIWRAMLSAAPQQEVK